MKKSGFLVAKFLKSFSLFCLVLLLLYTYYYLPDKLATHFSLADIPDQYMSKTAFFYGVGIIAVVFFTFASLLSKMVESVNINKFIIPNRTYWTKDKESKSYFYKVFTEWLNSLSLLVNLFLIICVFVVLKSHGSENNLSMNDFKWLPLTGGIFLVIWIFFLPIRLRIKKYNLLA